MTKRTLTIEDPPHCESCGQVADVRLKDGSTWCDGCNEAAHSLGYDRLKGRPITLMEVR